MIDLKGKTIIITGGSRGIGRACCLAFAKEGTNIAFTFNTNQEKADELEKELVALGVECLGLQTDARDYDQCRETVRKTLEKFGRLDMVLNNAGIVRDKALMMMSVEEWKDVIDTNLGGTFNMTRAAITTFLKQKDGCVINMSSVSGLSGMPRQTNYSASKAGIIGFTKALAKEVAGYNVRVNAVCPGFIETDMVSGMQAKNREKIEEAVPVKRLGSAEEVAKVCVFLARSPYIIGETIRIDGGLAV